MTVKFKEDKPERRIETKVGRLEFAVIYKEPGQVSVFVSPKGEHWNKAHLHAYKPKDLRDAAQALEEIANWIENEEA
ncbi:MAG: hypothetical protein KDH96_12570 [Candidatus Riesia sp.]|nr:hypothetical protein [Candidatus Riesia sp.]